MSSVSSWLWRRWKTWSGASTSWKRRRLTAPSAISPPTRSEFMSLSVWSVHDLPFLNCFRALIVTLKPELLTETQFLRPSTGSRTSLSRPKNWPRPRSWSLSLRTCKDRGRKPWTTYLLGRKLALMMQILQ